MITLHSPASPDERQYTSDAREQKPDEGYMDLILCFASMYTVDFTFELVIGYSELIRSFVGPRLILCSQGCRGHQ
jgi:hypothetical protein